jgi:hypothetical protein
MSRARDTADQINRINSSAADATAITVTSSENVGIGTTSPSSNYGFSKTVEIQGGVNSELSLSQTNNSKDWSFGVGNGNCYQQTNSGQNYSWYTGGVEKLRIQSGGGISFNGDTAVANALNDYETGTWTPQYDANTITWSYQSQFGVYVKVGKLVHIQFYLNASIASGTSGFSTKIINLPFTSANLGALHQSGMSIWFSGSGSDPRPLTDNASTTISLWKKGAVATATAADVNAQYLVGGGTYYAS